MNRLMIRTSVFTVVTAVGCIALAASPPGPIQIKVRNKVLHRIDARLFGQFMERASWGRACLFALCEAGIALVAMKLMPLNFFILKVLAGLFAALLVSPLAFRALLTQENARALLGSMLLTVVGAGGAILLFLL